MSLTIDPGTLSDQTKLGRLLSIVENDPGQARGILASLPEPPAGSHRLGVTGSPGVGKSTLLGCLVKKYRERGHRVGVVAVDPTSPFSGGAILGDRIRLADQFNDPGVFIRSLGSRGSLGGVTPGAGAVAGVLEAAGYDRILIETVGVGQTGYDVICLADTVVALFSPEAGDGIQLLKAGILEVGDIFAVNKSDRPGAENMLKEILISLEINGMPASDAVHHGLTATGSAGTPGSTIEAAWEPPVIRAVARDNIGITEIIDAVEKHHGWLESLPSLHPRRVRRLTRELAFAIRARINILLDSELRRYVEKLSERIIKGELNVWDAVEQLRSAVGDSL